MSEAAKPPLEITCSRHFPAFLAAERLSLVFTTYQASKVFFIGLNGERLSFHERSFTRCMGLAASPETVWLSSGFQIWRLENCLNSGVQHEGGSAAVSSSGGFVSYALGQFELRISDVATIVEE